jgi:hypothetical protein
MGVTGWGGDMTLYVECDFGSYVSDTGTPSGPAGGSTWDAAIWDDSGAKYAGYEPIWVDVTADLQNLKTARSFSRDTNKYNTATASFVLKNTSGKYSVTNSAGPYYGKIGILRKCRIRCVYTGSGTNQEFYLFYGYTQTWKQHYPDMGTNATVEIDLVALESQIANFSGQAQSSQGAGETTGQRVQRILTNSGWAGISAIDDGATTMNATTLEGSAMTLLQDAADVEGGYMYWDEAGTARFEGINALAEKGRLNSGSYVLFSDQADTSSVQSIFYKDIKFSYDGDLLRNIYIYGSETGIPQLALSTNSRSLFGDRSEVKTDFKGGSDSHMLRLANRNLILHQNPEFRVDSVVFSAMSSINDAFDASTNTHKTPKGYKVWKELASGRLGVRRCALVTTTPKYEVDPVVRFCIIEGISHSIPDSKTWDITMQFSSAEPYVGVGTAVFDGIDPQDGYFDQTKWGW